MGKNQKHQKKLKSEKSKVKLRVKGEKTKFLPKGKNVTDTTFKIKPICLPDQLQVKSNEEPLSKRKLNTKELIQRLKHHNDNVKRESAEELCVIISAYPEEILNKYLSQLLQSSCQLILDREAKVRKLSIKLLDVILRNVTVVKIEPLFSVISSFLRCSMTNIDSNIQEDSLMLLDVLLKHVPTLVAKDSEKILSNFLTLISILRTDSKPGRTLTVNLGSKLTTVKWKVKVLHRLKGILESVIHMDGNVDRLKSTIIPHQTMDSKYRCPLYKSIKQLTWNVDTVQDIDSDVISKQVNSLITLLHESWLEVAPEKPKHMEKSDCANLSADAAAILNCILSILQLLNKHIEMDNISQYNLKSELQSRDYRKLVRSTLEHFPYGQIKMQQQRNKSNIGKVLEVQTDSKCLQENLLICYLTLRMDYNTEELQKVISYINKCLKNRNYVTTDKMHLLINILNVLLIETDRKLFDQEELMENVIEFFNSNYLSNDSKKDVLLVLANAINNSAISASPIYHVWLSGLPALLCNNEIHENVIDKMSLIAKRGCRPFHNALVKRMQSILDNIQKIKIISTSELNATDEELLRTRMLNMFTHSTNIYKDHLVILKDYILRNKHNAYGNYMEFNFPSFLLT